MAADHLDLARLPQLREPDPELLAHLAADRRLGRLAAAQAAAGDLPRVPPPVGVADEQDAVAVAQNALDAARYGLRTSHHARSAACAAR